jgi:Peroxidase, family 2
MQPLSFFLVLALTGLALGVDFNNWEKPKKGDIRGPCPALNSLANHNIIPHDGKGMTIPLLQKALGEALNVSPEFGETLAFLGTLTAPDPSKGQFNLDDLLKHNVFEHDASLSRADFDLNNGQVQALDKKIFKEFMSHFDGLQNVTLQAAADARYSRILDSRARNPKFTYTPQHQITSYSETMFYFRSLVDPNTGETPVNFVKILFGKSFAILPLMCHVPSSPNCLALLGL